LLRRSRRQAIRQAPAGPAATGPAISAAAATLYFASHIDGRSS
jgi:hypothetical protein